MPNDPRREIDEKRLLAVERRLGILEDRQYPLAPNLQQPLYSRFRIEPDTDANQSGDGNDWIVAGELDVNDNYVERSSVDTELVNVVAPGVYRVRAYVVLVASAIRLAVEMRFRKNAEAASGLFTWGVTGPAMFTTAYQPGYAEATMALEADDYVQLNTLRDGNTGTLTESSSSRVFSWMEFEWLGLDT